MDDIKFLIIMFKNIASFKRCTC